MSEVDVGVCLGQPPLAAFPDREALRGGDDLVEELSGVLALCGRTGDPEPSTGRNGSRVVGYGPPYDAC